jgi:hypothetical protein
MLIALAMGLSMTTVVAKEAPQFEAADKSKTSQLCVTLATGNKHQIKNAIKSIRPAHGLKQNYRFVANRVTCNGLYVHEFAANAGNDANVEFFAKYINEKDQTPALAANHGFIK